MVKFNSSMIPATALLLSLTLTACGSESTENSATEPTSSTKSSPAGHGSEHSHAYEHPSDGGPAPKGMKPSREAKFANGSKVKILTDHMDGLKDAKGTVVASFDTTIYAVDYIGTDGMKVHDHKWVVHEELDNPKSQPLPNGAKIRIKADHMPGMRNATGRVAFSTTEPVYQVNYEADGKVYKNHKWVTESEITAW